MYKIVDAKFSVRFWNNLHQLRWNNLHQLRWNNLHQLRSLSKDWKDKPFVCIEIWNIKPETNLVIAQSPPCIPQEQDYMGKCLLRT
jgi:hypothetical protein